MMIGKHEVRWGKSVFVVAELSCNHLGSYDRAVELVERAAWAGADAVKLQHDNPDGGITIDCDNEWFQIKEGPWKGQTLYQLYKRTYTPWHWIATLKPMAEKLGMECFSTPSSVDMVALLEEAEVPCYKVSSFEACDLPLLEAIVATGKPILISTGCYQGNDICNVLYGLGYSTGEVLFLHCLASYPSEESHASLPLGVIEGFSDHSLSTLLPALAVAAGACVIEKHFTLRRADGGEDAGFSMEPEEFKEMVGLVRRAEAACMPRKRVLDKQFCKSLFAVADIKAGERFTESNVASIRPGYGLPPSEYRRVLGCRAKMDIVRGTPLTEAML